MDQGLLQCRRWPQRFAGLAACAMALGLAACASAPVSQEALRGVTTINNTPKVTLTDKVSYNGPETSIGALGGIVGAVAAQSATPIPRQIADSLKAQGVDVAEIVRSEFQSALTESKQLSGRLAEKGQAQFVLHVYVYGLSQSGPFSSEYKPYIAIRATLVREDGVIVWEGRDGVTQHNDTVPRAPWKAYFASPEPFSKGFSAAARTVSRLLVGSLDGKS